MNNDLVSREWLKDAFDNLCCHNCKICRNFRNEDSFYKCDLIENASSVEAYPFEQVQELVKLNQQFAREIENLKKPQGEQIPVSEIPNDREYDEGFNAGYAEAIKNIPEYRELANKLQRPHGKWKFDGWSIYCSECGYRPKIGGSNFCSECGADMRGEKE